MPAIYAHDRFGKEVYQKMTTRKAIIKKYYTQYQIGLQGPDIFFFYRPYTNNRVVKYGNHLHTISAYPFFNEALKVVKEKGVDSSSYAYLMGFVCHYSLDSECHGYVDEMIHVIDVQHLEIEEEFDKYLMRKDRLHPLTYPMAKLIPFHEADCEAIASFYENISEKDVATSLKGMGMVKRLLYAPKKGKHAFVNGIMKLTGKHAYLKGLMHQHKDNKKCFESNEGLMRRYEKAVAVALQLMDEVDQAIDNGQPLGKRFDRNFE